MNRCGAVCPGRPKHALTRENSVPNDLNISYRFARSGPGGTSGAERYAPVTVTGWGITDLQSTP